MSSPTPRTSPRSGSRRIGSWVGHVVEKLNVVEIWEAQLGALATTFHSNVRPGSTTMLLCVATRSSSKSDGLSPSNQRYRSYVAAPLTASQSSVTLPKETVLPFPGDRRLGGPAGHVAPASDAASANPNANTKLQTS